MLVKVSTLNVSPAIEFIKLTSCNLRWNEQKLYIKGRSHVFPQPITSSGITVLSNGTEAAHTRHRISGMKSKNVVFYFGLVMNYFIH